MPHATQEHRESWKETGRVVERVVPQVAGDRLDGREEQDDVGDQRQRL
jgi:hypothetical protein